MSAEVWSPSARPGRTLLLLLLIRNTLLSVVYSIPALFMLLATPYMPLLVLFAGMLWLQLRLFLRPVSTAEAVTCWALTLLAELIGACIAWKNIADFNWVDQTAGRNLFDQAGIALMHGMSESIWLPFLVFLPFVPGALLRTLIADDSDEPEPTFWLLPPARRTALGLLIGHMLLALGPSVSTVLLMVLALRYGRVCSQPVTWRYAARACVGSLLVCGGLSVASAAIFYFLEPTSEGPMALLQLAAILSPFGREFGWWFLSVMALNMVGAGWLLRRLWQTRPAAAEA